MVEGNPPIPMDSHIKVSMYHGLGGDLNYLCERR